MEFQDEIPDGVLDVDHTIEQRRCGVRPSAFAAHPCFSADMDASRRKLEVEATSDFKHLHCVSENRIHCPTKDGNSQYPHMFFPQKMTYLGVLMSIV